MGMGGITFKAKYEPVPEESVMAAKDHMLFKAAEPMAKAIPVAPIPAMVSASVPVPALAPVEEGHMPVPATDSESKSESDGKDVHKFVAPQ